MVYYYNHPVKVLTKIFFAPFLALFLPKFVRFDPKIEILANFSQSTQSLLLILHIQTTFMVYYQNLSSGSFDKKLFHPFLVLFYTNLSVLTTKNVILTHFSHSAHRILLLFHIKTILMVFYHDYLGKVLRKVCFALLLTRF